MGSDVDDFEETEANVCYWCTLRVSNDNFQIYNRDLTTDKGLADGRRLVTTFKKVNKLISLSSPIDN